MSYEYDEELPMELQDLFQEGSETLEGHIREVEALDEGVVSERILNPEAQEAIEAMELPKNPELVGDPQEAMEHWHRQTEDMSCAVASQCFVAEQLLDTEMDETKMIEYAEQHGWYENGTYPEDVGKLLEAMGLDVERHFEGSMEEIEQTLESGGKVMVSVNNAVLQQPFLANFPGFDANHVVEVIGIDKSDPTGIKVILNDPGVENGGGIVHELSTFQSAWATGGNFITTAYRPTAERSV